MALEPAPPSRDKITFRRCALLCLPALALGLALRVAFLISIPEGYYGSDSNSYFETADKLWNEHKWELGPKRRGIYPPLLALAPLLPGSTAQVAPIAQHLLGLISLIGIGWITAHLTRRHFLWVPLVTMICALLPRPLWYEHEIIADSLVGNTLILAIALALPITKLRTRSGLFWFLIAAGLIVAVKPHGRPLWFGLVVAAVVIAGNPLRWGWKNLAVLAATLVVIFNTGKSRQSSWLFLSSTLPLVQPEGDKWQEYRRALTPLIADASTNLTDYPWRQEVFKKILNNPEAPQWSGTQWPLLLRDEKLFPKVAKGLALEAVRKHPVAFAQLVMKKFAIVLSRPGFDYKFYPTNFWEVQSDRNESRWARDPKQLGLFYEFDQAAYQARIAERAKRPALLMPGWFQPADYVLWLKQVSSPGNAHPALRITWFAALGVLGILRCCLPRNFRPATLLVLPTFIYLAAIYTVGDSLPRYLTPVEWVGVVLGALGGELMIDFILRFIGPRREAVMEAPGELQSAA